ncbi:hypothetical protein A5886_000197 [Enterococcus sp. 8G7_MSG3316]|uniref:Peptidoglycan hydrolase n=1 Tax=Candidatus Enterococcus testudinis TaxID=1834191 RepID=A0A242A264_9ENTE|nr:LysM peptidoglycan-binding domain-containing protein [Enterococcus sp. 8G7_MSG3316]OTN75127.1 hypothetical protein A5886_000197 [Enterococcus sp. 8G7_MSG3316]
METSQTQKVQQQREHASELYQVMRKSAAVLGTTLTAISVVTPLMPAVQAEAVETSVAQVSTSNFAAPNTSAFITEIATYAQPVAQANDLYASVMIAQAILESGWGRSSLSKAPNYNLFGVKGSYNGQTVYMSTLEYLNGQWVTMSEPFRQYPSYTQSFQDNASVIRSNSYYSGAWKSNTSSYLDATAWLTGRYATAPNYASSLNAVIQQYGLTKYDTPASGNAGGGATVNTSTITATSTTTSTTTSGSTYTVVSGDSVWSVANKYGISMDQLRSANNIQNDFIYPGQTLAVSGSTNTATSSTTVSLVNKNATTAASATGSYTVVSGDSVWSVANKYGISMDQLRSANNIQNDFIYPGQTLSVSSSSSTTSTASTSNTTSTANTTTTSSKGTYTVVSGDSVWSIANKNNISMDQLRSINNIQNDFVYPGQQLSITGASTTSTSSSTTSTTASAGTYTVASGDSVWGIANQFGISTDQFIQWNNIQNNFIYPGQSVRVK